MEPGKIACRVDTIAGRLVRALSVLQHALLFILRLNWGYQFFLSGRGKLMGIDRTANFFASLGIPLPKLNALMAGATECFGGLLLLVGFAARPVSIPLAGTMAVAYATAHREELGAIFSDPNKFTSAAPFPFLLVALLVLAFGPGLVSLDALLAWSLSARIRSAGLVALWLGLAAPLVTATDGAGGPCQGGAGPGGPDGAGGKAA
jgi:putative oxidoreductase